MVILAIAAFVGGIMLLIMIVQDRRSWHDSENRFEKTMADINRHNYLHRMGLQETAYLFTEFGLKMSDGMIKELLK